MSTEILAPDEAVRRVIGAVSRAHHRLRRALATSGPCLDFADCNGVCTELMEAFAMSDAILSKGST